MVLASSRLQVAIPLIFQGPTAKVTAPEGSKTVSQGPMTNTVLTDTANLCFAPEQ